MRLGVMMAMPGDPNGVGGLIESAQRAERAGFSSAWLPQVFGLDALTVLALAGRETSVIELGTAVVPTYPRHPAVLAGQALTVQDASDGRLALGIGLSHRFVIEDVLGLDYSQPIPHMREYLTVLNGLLTGKPLKFDGSHYKVAAQVSVPGAARPPVLVAALGPAMLRLCGRLADGTVTWAGGLEYLRDTAVPTICAAAATAGRPAPRIVAMVPIAITRDAGGARQAANKIFRGYSQIPSYRATLDRGGAAGLGDIAVVGAEEEVENQLRAFSAAGVTDLNAVIFPAPGGDSAGTYEFLGALSRRGLA